ncbi:MAG: hypothetical protein KBG42_11160 [Lachnospiraceae bacterium]|nr:hypothetical protein [Lachnospiraceae bacterium]
MEFTADTNGITIKKLFGKIEITYPEIQSIINSSHTTFINLKSGKTYKRNMLSYLTDDFPVIFDAIERYNITYKDEVEESYSENPYTIEDIRHAYERLQKDYAEYANELISEKLGNEYSIDLVAKETVGSTKLYYILMKDGSPVNIPFDQKLTDSSEMPESFENYELAILYEWDTSYRRGNYSIQSELENAAEGKQAIRETIDEFCEYYMP